MSDAVLSCSNVSLGYEDRIICRNINFMISHGECLCVVGGSGSGRSALLRVILGTEQPSTGNVAYENGITKNDIGCLPQVRDSRINSTVREVVLAGCLRRGRLPFFTKEDKNIARERLELIGITSLAKRRFCDLSGGMQQKVLLARALCAAKKLLLLDDPVHGLDKSSADEIYSLIETICISGMPIIMVSDDIPAVLRLSTHILHLSDTPLFFGAKSDYLKTYPGKMFESGIIL